MTDIHEQELADQIDREVASSDGLMRSCCAWPWSPASWWLASPRWSARSDYAPALGITGET